MDDIETQQWEVFDYLQDNLKKNKYIKSVYCAEEFPPTLGIVTKDGGSFELPIDVMTDEFDPHSSPELKFGYLDNETGSIVTSIRKALSKWNYAKDIYCIDDRNFGSSILKLDKDSRLNAYPFTNDLDIAI